MKLRGCRWQFVLMFIFGLCLIEAKCFGANTGYSCESPLLPHSDTSNEREFLNIYQCMTALNAHNVTASTATILNLVGTTTNNNATAGSIGEYVESYVGYTNEAATANWLNLTSISLTAGDWDVVGQMIESANSATTTNGFRVAVSLFSGNTTTDHIDGYNVMYGFNNYAGTFNVSSASVVYRISLSATTTVYLKARGAYSAGTPQVAGTIRARRVR